MTSPLSRLLYGYSGLFFLAAATVIPLFSAGLLGGQKQYLRQPLPIAAYTDRERQF